MRKSIKLIASIILTVMFLLTACSDETDNTPELSGAITITVGGSPVTESITGTMLTANYNGTESVTCQWNLDSSPINGANNLNLIPESPGEYTVTVSSANYKSKTSAIVTVTGDPLLPGTLTINTSYNQDILQLTIQYSGEVNPVTCQWSRNGFIIPGATNQTYIPVEAGDYTATISAPGTTYKSKTSYSIPVIKNGIRFFVGYNNLDDAIQYLTTNTGGTSVDNYVILPLIMDLGNMTQRDSGWRNLLTAIENAGKYVSLNLSACTMIGTEFNPDISIEIGKNKIVSITLPDIATSIVPVGSLANMEYSTFRYFDNLKLFNGIGLTSIGDGAFSGCTSLTTVSFPAVTSIGDYAFRGCTSLTTVSLPALTSIGGGAFSDCTSLTTVELPALTSIDATRRTGAFSDCTSLTSISLPALTSIGAAGGNSGAFSGCTSLTTVSLPLVTTIGTNAFSGCTSLTSISLPVLTFIGYGAFSDCTSLKSISLPALSSISGGYAIFYGCTSLESISLPALTSIGDGSGFDFGNFSGCTNLTTVSFPLVTSIGDYAFRDCTSLALTSLPAGVTSIGDYAFYRCTNLALTSLPVGLTTIGASAFQTSGLTSIVIPASVTIIGEYAFYISSIFSVTFEGATIGVNNEGLNINAFLGDLYSKYLAGGAGTYTRESGGETWLKQ